MTEHPPRLPAAPYTCTTTTLVLHRPVGAMAPGDQTPLLRWLAAHGLAPDEIAVGRPIRRDTARRLVRWTGAGPGSPISHVRHVPVEDDDGPWPAPFPEALITAVAFTDPDGYVLEPR